MIGKNINKILNNNIEILRIYNGGGVIWQKLYNWNKFRVIKEYKVSRYPDEVLEEFRNMTFTDNRVSRFPNGELVRGTNLTIFDKVYIERLYGDWIPSTHITDYMADLRVFLGKGSDYALFKVHIYTIKTFEGISGYSKGKYLSEVTSTNIDEYPKSGEKNGYWYELIQ